VTSKPVSEQSLSRTKRYRAQNLLRFLGASENVLRDRDALDDSRYVVLCSVSQLLLSLTTASGDIQACCGGKTRPREAITYKVWGSTFLENPGRAASGGACDNKSRTVLKLETGECAKTRSLPAPKGILACLRLIKPWEDGIEAAIEGTIG
jgi:hypothetical protein